MTNSHLEQMASDIKVARQQATFPIEELTKALYGGELILHVITKLRALLAKEPLLDGSKMNYMSRAEVRGTPEVGTLTYMPCYRCFITPFWYTNDSCSWSMKKACPTWNSMALYCSRNSCRLLVFTTLVSIQDREREREALE